MRHIKLVPGILKGLPSRMGFLRESCLELIKGHLHSGRAQVCVKPATEPVLLVPLGLAMPSEMVRVVLPLHPPDHDNLVCFPHDEAA